MHAHIFADAGIYEASFIKPVLAADFIKNMTNDEKQKWKDKHGKSVGDSLREYALEYVGKPIDNMLKYVCLHKNSFRRQM